MYAADKENAQFYGFDTHMKSRQLRQKTCEHIFKTMFERRINEHVIFIMGNLGTWHVP